MIGKIALRPTCRGLKAGDKVRVIRKAEAEENGWDDIWVSSMNNSIGNVLSVVSIHGTNGVKLNLDGTKKNDYVYPWFVLEVVE